MLYWAGDECVFQTRVFKDDPNGFAIEETRALSLAVWGEGANDLITE